MKFATGQAVTRVEDATLVKGQGRYADDVLLKDAAGAALRAVLLRSPHAHARIRAIDTAAAKAAPGVVAVLTSADAKADGLGEIPCLIPLKSLDGKPRGNTPRPLLADGTVRHVGEPVALVVAQTLGQARDAAELIKVDYEPLASVVDARLAARPGAPQVWPDIPDNTCFDWGMGNKAATEEAFAKSAHVVRVDLNNNRVVVNSMEPRAALAEYDPATDRSTLYTPTQGVHLIHGQIATALKLDKQKVRVVSGNVGGAFGMKLFLHHEQPLLVWVSRRLKRAVRWTAERSEGFLSDVQGRDNLSLVELALDKDAKFLGLRVTTHANLGAYLSNYGPFIPTSAGTPMLAALYRTPAIWVNVKGMVTNTVPVDAYRGAGRPEAIYAVERVIDAAARQLGLGPDEIRRRNFIQPSDMPFKTCMDTVYDSGDFPAILAKAMEQADWKGFAARRRESEARGKLRGIGVAGYIEKCGGGAPETAVLKVGEDGRVTLLAGMQDNGQGHATTMTQLVSEKLGIDAETISVVQGDSDLTPNGFTGGSRFLAVGGAAAVGASDEVIRKGRELAADELEAAPGDIEFADGEFRIAGTDRKLSIFDAARVAKKKGALLEATFTRTPEAVTFPNGCHVAEVEIDRDTGVLSFARYTIVDDLGRAINPMLVEGQIHGGTVQGIGQALMEHAVYDDESGQLVTGSFMDYAMPRADDVPNFDCGFHNVPCTTNPLGVKGAGEAGAVGAAPAVVNAIVDALHAANGTTHIDMPVTREKLWRALNPA